MVEERLAAHLAGAWLAWVGGQLALHHHLRGDAGVVGAGLPQRVEAAHPVPADQDVLQRVVEGVAHVQRAGHVGRRDHDRERSRPGLGIGAGLEGARLFPGGIEAGLGLGGVEGLVHGLAPLCRVSA
jgi:hypothetical protein